MTNKGTNKTKCSHKWYRRKEGVICTKCSKFDRGSGGGYYKPVEQDVNLVFIRNFCKNLESKLIDKYLKGQEEHGEDVSQLDCEKEVNLEILDIINYFSIEKAKIEKIRIEEDDAEAEWQANDKRGKL